MPDNFITPKTRKEYFAAKIGGLVSDEGPVMPMGSIGKDYFFNNVESDWQTYNIPAHHEDPAFDCKIATIWMSAEKRAEFLEKVNNDPDNATVIVDGHKATFCPGIWPSALLRNIIAWTIWNHSDNGLQNGYDFVAFTDVGYDKAIATIDVYTEGFIEVSPKTPIEKYLAKIAGNDVELPTPKTAMEYALNAIAESGGGSGGGGDVYDAVEIINIDSIPWTKEIDKISGAEIWTASVELDTDFMENMHANVGDIMISEFGSAEPRACIAVGGNNNIVIYSYVDTDGRPIVTTTIRQVQHAFIGEPVHWYVMFNQDSSYIPEEQSFVCTKLVKRT